MVVFSAYNRIDTALAGDNSGHGRRGSVPHLTLDHGRKSNLIQTSECDWDSEDMDIEENQMKRHLKHLQLLKRDSKNSSNL